MGGFFKENDDYDKRVKLATQAYKRKYGQKLRERAQRVKHLQNMRKEYKERITDIYKLYNPDELDTIEDILESYSEKEHELYLMICNKYNVPASARKPEFSTP